jgi:fucose permease
MKRYIIFTGIMVGATIMAIGASIVGAVSYLGDKLIGRE